MLKYTVTKEATKTEFSDETEATSYASAISGVITQSDVGETSSLQSDQQTVIQKIKAMRDYYEQDGCKIVVDSVDKWIHTTVPSRIQHLGLSMMGANIPANLQWKTMDGTYITMTQTVAGQIFVAIAALDIAAFTAAETHIATMLAGNDPLNYDFSSGWPETFTG